jgi:ElaB/YqjD/DUF883 family membrane-anchored ribosome-binding protein
MLRQTLKGQGDGPVNSINDALELLNEANQKLKRIAVDAGDAALDTAKDVSGRALWMSKQAARRLDESAHENAWKFVGFASAMSVLTGYYFGRCARR